MHDTGRLLIDGSLRAGRLTVQGGVIESITSVPETPGMPVIAPGLIDLHIHGFGGFDPIESLDGMARSLARAGTTSFQPTLFPAEPTKLGELAEDGWRIASKLDEGARAVGFHLEGPFVNPLAAGALPVSDLATPSVEALRAILGPATGDGRGIRTVTLAPELAGSADLVEELVRCDVRVSLGHTKATSADAKSAFRAGAEGATHLFNAMPQVHHREVGVTGFAICERAIFSEIIGDLVHVSAEAFELALRAHGTDSLCLVSDALRGAGTGCEVFHSHGRAHEIIDGTAYYPVDETRAERQLAGSASSQLEMVRKLANAGVCTLEEALTLGSHAPARALGLDRELGALKAGAYADWIVLNAETLALEGVVVRGEALALD